MTIITEFLPGTRTLAEILSEEALVAGQWSEIGNCIARFHSRGVFHADLNAHNILLSESDEVFLLDFDKGKLLAPGEWCQANLSRLLRSLNKLAGEKAGFNFDSFQWSSFLEGYKSGINSQP